MRLVQTKSGCLWNRIISSGMKGVAPGNAFGGEKQALYNTMPGHGLIGILGTAGVKPARRPQKGRKHQLIPFY